MSLIQSKDANPRGLHQRYIVTKADGSPIDPKATYFVLRLDSNGTDAGHIAACRCAAKEYAENAPVHLKVMAKELLDLVESLDKDDITVLSAVVTMFEELQHTPFGDLKHKLFANQSAFGAKTLESIVHQIRMRLERRQ